MGYQEIMYLSISIAVLLLAIFGSIALFYLIMILRDTNKAVEGVKETVDKFNEYILSPVRVVNAVMEKLKPYYESFVENREEEATKKRKKKA